MEWISVKDKLPDGHDRVLAFCDEGIYTGYLSPIKSWFCSCECFEGSYIEGVTHWMPLPPPPK